MNVDGGERNLNQLLFADDISLVIDLENLRQLVEKFSRCVNGEI